MSIDPPRKKRSARRTVKVSRSNPRKLRSEGEIGGVGVTRTRILRCKACGDEQRFHGAYSRVPKQITCKKCGVKAIPQWISVDDK